MKKLLFIILLIITVQNSIAQNNDFEELESYIEINLNTPNKIYKTFYEDVSFRRAIFKNDYIIYTVNDNLGEDILYIYIDTKNNLTSLYLYDTTKFY